MKEELNQKQGNLTPSVKVEFYNLRLYFYRLRKARIKVSDCISLCCDRFQGQGITNNISCEYIVSDLIQDLTNFEPIEIE